MSFQIELDEYNQKMQRNVKNKCQICKEDFSILKREHICKRCFRSVCDDDSPYKVTSYRKDKLRKLHRMCRVCHLESEVLNAYIQKNKLGWAKDSDYAKNWLKQYKSKQIQDKSDRIQSEMYFSNDQEYLSMNQMWQSLNFSFRQYLGIIMDAMTPYDQTQIMKVVNSGLIAINRKKVSQLHNSIYILLFFLTHLSLPNSIYLTLEILKIINKNPPSIQNVMNYLQQLGCTQIQLYKVQSFLQDVFDELVNKLTLNMFTAQMSIQIITLVLVNKSSQQLQKGIAFVLSQRKQYICQNNNKKVDIFDDILKNISSSNYRKKIKQLKSLASFQQSQQIKVKKVQYQKLLEQNKTFKASLQSKQKQIAKLKLQKKQRQQKLKEKDEEKIQIKNRQTQETDHKQNQPEVPFQTKSKRSFTINNDKNQNTQQVSSLSIQQQQQWNQLLQNKNNEIGKLREQLKQLQHNYKEVCEVNQDKQFTQRQEKQSQKTKIKQQQKQLQSSKKLVQSLKNMNNLLLMKMNQLSQLIMDKEQAMLKQNEQQYLQPQLQPRKQYKQIKEELEQLKKQNGECLIY